MKNESVKMLALLTWALATTNGLTQPQITNQPPWLQVCRGSPAAFSVGATGTPPLSYQWYAGTTPSASNILPGETNATLIWPDIQGSRAFTVIVTNSEGSVTSAQARAYLNTPFGITQQPADATIEIGSTFLCSVTVTSAVTPSLQWYFNGQPLAGKTTATLTIPNVQSNNVGDYWLTVTNACGSETSLEATLRILGPGATFTEITEGPVATDIVTDYSACWGDFDGDGLFDLAVVGGADPGTNTQFYHNEGNGQFTRLTNSAVPSLTSTGVYAVWSDLENDGDVDLFMVAKREMFVYRNHGGGQFTREPAPVDLPVTGDTISWADYDGDGFLDAFLGVWLGWDPPGSRNALLHNRGDGTFAVVSDQPLCLVDSSEESSSWVDFDNDGDLDLFAARPGGTYSTLIYRNDGNGQFVEATPEPLRSELLRRIGGAWADFDNDGDLDLFAPAWSTNSSMLYINEGHGTFVHWAGQPSSLTSSLTSRHAVWGDYDNDGYLDLFVAAGPSLPCRLYRNLGDGNFLEIKSAAPAELHSQCPSWADYDNDGALDLFVATAGEGPNRLYHNNGNTNHWLKVRLKGTKSNSYAVGARVFVTASMGGKTVRQMRQITAQTLCQELEAHFGLGDATRVETLLVEWPSATRRMTEWHNLAAGQILTLTEPTNDPPVIVIEPPNQTNLIGSDITLCVTASGTPPLSYQWRDYTTGTSFTDIPGATNSCLTFSDMQPTAHRFRVVISNPWGAVTSRLVQVVIQTPPYFTEQPTDQVIGVGENYTNEVVAGGDPTLRYQWYFVAKGTSTTNLLPGKTANLLYMPNVQFTNSGAYFVVVTNLVGMKPSRLASLDVVNLPPTIVVQPASTTVEVGQTYTNGVVASGTMPLSYQWYWGTTVLAGKTASTLVITNVQFTNAGGYSVFVTNLYGSVPSVAAPLTVVPAMFSQITTGVLVTDTTHFWNASWVDYDGDGNLDLSAAPGTSSAATLLYHNEGGGTFRKVTTNAIAQTAVQAYNHVWGDYDNDGKLDLFVPNTGAMNDVLFHNDGNGAFTRITTGHPVIDGVDSMCGAWADYDRDGFLDLFVSIWTGPNDLLYRNNGDGTFRKMTIPEVGVIVGDSALGDYVTWADVDNDGWPELSRTVGNAYPGPWTNQLLHLDSQGKFYLMDIGEMKKGNVGFTAVRAWADYDNDGFLDAFLDAEKGGGGLYRNLAGLVFTNVAPTAFPNLLTNAFAWCGVDFDNDGWLDAVVYTAGAPSPALFWNNGDGTFTSRTVGGLTSAIGWHVWGDYDNNGFPDVLVARGDGNRSSLFRHNGNSNHWLKVKLHGRVSNRYGIGAKVRVNATIRGTNFWQMREISGQGLVGYDNGLLAHFGLGDATNVMTLKIEWPSGHVTEIPNVAANQFLAIQEPPGLDCASWGPGGMQLRVVGNIGERYDVWTSSDIAASKTNWVFWQTVTNTGRVMPVLDPSPTAPQRFYKATPAQ